MGGCGGDFPPGYDYEIIYKKVKGNVVVDVLSRKYEDKGSLFYLYFLVL
jgi:hypothetical protein